VGATQTGFLASWNPLLFDAPKMLGVLGVNSEVFSPCLLLFTLTVRQRLLLDAGNSVNLRFPVSRKEQTSRLRCGTSCRQVKISFLISSARYSLFLSSFLFSLVHAAFYQKDRLLLLGAHFFSI